MKYLAAALLALALGCAPCALAQETTYVFPYEGFRYTQKENQTVLTQTNLGEHEALIQSLGTTKDAILASYIASGVVMTVIPDDGGQIAVSVASAGDYADVRGMDKLTPEERAGFAASFEESGLYESCALTQTSPVCVRLTSSAMYGSMPVYTLRYATLHLGRLYMLTQSIVGREPAEEDDARMADVLSGMKLLATVSDPTPEPTPVPTPTPEPTPTPTAGVAEVLLSEGAMQVDELPAYTNEGKITISGRTTPSAAVRVAVDDRTIGKTTAHKDGAFSVTATLPEEGDLVLAVMTDDAEAMIALHYDMPAARLTLTEPKETVFTGDYVMARGETEPGATVYIEGEGMKTSVKANKNGAFSVRLFVEEEDTRTFTLRARADGLKESETSVTVTRKYTLREGIAKFRSRLISVSYADMAKAPEKYTGKRVMFRGKVMAFTDYDGSPCALVCVDNTSPGVWKDPIWVVLTGEEEIAVDNVVTFYLTGEGLTLPADGSYTKSGVEVEAPVTRAAYVTEIK